MIHSHCTGQGPGLGPRMMGFYIRPVLCTLHRDMDRDREPLFFIVPTPVPVTFPVPIPYRVYKPFHVSAVYFHHISAQIS